jgi:hypothetical protein
MAENKTQENERSVNDFLNSVQDEKKRADSFVILEIMRQVTGKEPKMWGDSIVGFGKYHYRYESGREGDEPVTGFSPRKQNLTLYLMLGFPQSEELLQRLGKFTTGKYCLYIKKIEDVDLQVLEELVRQYVDYFTQTHS